VRKIVKIGLDRFIDSWNNHRIPGRNRGIPYQRALENTRISPIDASIIPNTDNLIMEYRSNGGSINTNMSDLYPVIDMALSNRILSHLDASFEPMHYVQCFNLLLNGDSLILLEFIRSHHLIVCDYVN
jgi:hypothetical protein